MSWSPGPRSERSRPGEQDPRYLALMSTDVGGRNANQCLTSRSGELVTGEELCHRHPWLFLFCMHILSSWEAGYVDVGEVVRCPWIETTVETNWSSLPRICDRACFVGRFAFWPIAIVGLCVCVCVCGVCACVCVCVCVSVGEGVEFHVDEPVENGLR